MTDKGKFNESSAKINERAKKTMLKREVIIKALPKLKIGDIVEGELFDEGEVMEIKESTALIRTIREWPLNEIFQKGALNDKT